MSDQLHDRAESLYEDVGGNLCICQGADIPRWCEKCQQRIGFIRSVFIRLQNETYHDLCNSLGIPRERDRDGGHIVKVAKPCTCPTDRWSARFGDHAEECPSHETKA